MLKNPKAKVLLIAGMHGNEYSAVEVALYFKDIVEEYGYTNITVVPYANENALLNNSRTYVQNNTTDLNRSFSEGLETQVQAIEKMKKLILEHDLIIDIHNSPNCCNFALFDASYLQGLALCEAAGVTYAVRDTNVKNTLKYYANTLINKTAITYEFSPMIPTTKEGMDKAIIDITSLINAFDNYRFLRNNPPKQVEYVTLKNYFAQGTGYFKLYDTNLNRTYKPNEEIGILFADYGQKIDIRNPFDFPIQIIVLSHPYKSMDDILFQYIRV